MNGPCPGSRCLNLLRRLEEGMKTAGKGGTAGQAGSRTSSIKKRGIRLLPNPRKRADR
jgi:hypothetical protein